MTHTPTPWEVRKQVTQSHAVYFDIAQCPHVEGKEEYIMVSDVAGHDRQANAELIVKAVNSYEAMKEALETLEQDLEEGGEILQTDERRIRIIQEALAQAEGAPTP